MNYGCLYTLLYLKWITNKDLLFSTWNSAQCCGAGWMGAGFGGEWIHVHVWLSPFAVHEIMTTLIGYTPIHNKKLIPGKGKNRTKIKKKRERERKPLYIQRTGFNGFICSLVNLATEIFFFHSSQYYCSQTLSPESLSSEFYLWTLPSLPFLFHTLKLFLQSSTKYPKQSHLSLTHFQIWHWDRLSEYCPGSICLFAGRGISSAVFCSGQYWV